MRHRFFARVLDDAGGKQLGVEVCVTQVRAHTHKHSTKHSGTPHHYVKFALFKGTKVTILAIEAALCFVHQLVCGGLRGAAFCLPPSELVHGIEQKSPGNLLLW